MRSGWRAAGRPHQPVLFVNPKSGGGTAARSGVVERAREQGIEAVVLAPGQSLAALAEAAVAGGADALGMAGGDGSLAVVAAAAAAHELPFVCIPAGTRNHFALDVGVDRHDVVGALDAFSDGVERRIDMAEVNGRLFLNNVSLGIYGDAVQRSAYREAKLRTILETAQQVMGPTAASALFITDDAGREHRQPAVVLVSNNPYAVDQPVAHGTRPALDTGQLGVLLLDAPAPRPHPPARAWTARHLEVGAPATVHAGIDGEAADLNGPLRFAIRPASLRVRISRRHPGVSPSARNGQIAAYDGLRTVARFLADSSSLPFRKLGSSSGRSRLRARHDTSTITPLSRLLSAILGPSSPRWMGDPVNVGRVRCWPVGGIQPVSILVHQRRRDELFERQSALRRLPAARTAAGWWGPAFDCSPACPQGP